MTNRQYLTWQRWLDQQLNRPDRSDYYLMQLTALVSNLFSKSPSQVHEFLLKFNTEPEVEMSAQQRSEMAKMAWAARLRIPYKEMKQKEEDLNKSMRIGEDLD